MGQREPKALLLEEAGYLYDADLDVWVSQTRDHTLDGRICRTIKEQQLKDWIANAVRIGRVNGRAAVLLEDAGTGARLDHS
jgi:hypothetical protein